MYTIEPWNYLKPNETYDAWLDNYSDLGKYVISGEEVYETMERIEQATGERFDITEKYDFVMYMKWKYNKSVIMVEKYYWG